MSKQFHRKRGAQRPFRFYIASLGCPKNTVDANSMSVLLQRAGFEPTLVARQADIVIVNTCGFIEPARAESLETLEDLATELSPDQRLVATGCWAQREPAVIQQFVPRVDALLGTRSWGQIVSVANALVGMRGGDTFALIEDRLATMPEEAQAPGYVISGRSAFLKVADGCSRQCAFCAIPSIKGPNVSREMSAILRDAEELRDHGVLEINLIAQDATYYGYDLGLRDGLAMLLESLSQRVPEIPWLRVLYAFPGFVTDRLVSVMRDIPQVLPYVDIPLQHAHPDVLKRMRRPSDVDHVRRTISALREAMPDIALRTTFIVGYPGESEAEFATLLDFVQDMQFDRLGVFQYSHELGTPSADLADDVLPEVKEARYGRVMEAQQAISYARNQALIGRRLQVLLEGSGDGLTVGRSYRDAPEIDGLVLIPEEVAPHRLVTVEIDDAMAYDLTGHIVAP